MTFVSTPASAIRPFTDAYLLAYSGEHMAYEVDMFFFAVEVRRHPSFSSVLKVSATPRRVNNVSIESFVVHFRNVIDFLYNDNPRPTDIVASDFYDSTIWESVRPRMTGTLDSARRRANKELAHLTTDRIPGGPPEKIWDFDGLANELRPILRSFATNAKTTRISPLVAAAIR